MQGSQEGAGAFPQPLFSAVGCFGLPAGLRLAGSHLLRAPDLAPAEPLAAGGFQAAGAPAGPPGRLPPYDSPLKAFQGYRWAPGRAVGLLDLCCVCGIRCTDGECSCFCHHNGGRLSLYRMIHPQELTQ